MRTLIEKIGNIVFWLPDKATEQLAGNSAFDAVNNLPLPATMVIGAAVGLLSGYGMVYAGCWFFGIEPPTMADVPVAIAKASEILDSFFNS